MPGVLRDLKRWVPAHLLCAQICPGHRPRQARAHPLAAHCLPACQRQSAASSFISPAAAVAAWACLGGSLSPCPGPHMTATALVSLPPRSPTAPAQTTNTLPPPPPPPPSPPLHNKTPLLPTLPCSFLGIHPELPDSDLGMRNTREYHLRQKGSLDKGQEVRSVLSGASPARQKASSHSAWGAPPEGLPTPACPSHVPLLRSQHACATCLHPALLRRPSSVCCAHTVCAPSKRRGRQGWRRGGPARAVAHEHAARTLLRHRLSVQACPEQQRGPPAAISPRPRPHPTTTTPTQTHTARRFTPSVCPQADGWPMKMWQYEALVAQVRPDAQRCAAAACWPC